MPEVPADDAYRPLVRSDVLTTEIDGEMVVFDAPSDTVLKMNPSATTIWSCCDGTATVDEIAADIAEVYGVDEEVVRAQIADLLAQWSAKGLLANAIGNQPST